MKCTIYTVTLVASVTVGVQTHVDRSTHNANTAGFVLSKDLELRDLVL
jgi:hypothetical protein